MREALLYEKKTDQSVKCHVCPHYCEIKEGQRGVCGVRENRMGTLFALNFGMTVAVGIDPIEKKPLYHYLPGTKVYSLATVGCNLRCSWCQNHAISQSPKPHKIIQGEYIAPEEHVRRALETGCPAIAYTYTEPIIFLEYALEIMKAARAEGLRNIWVSAGFATVETWNLVIPWLDAINLDFKGPGDEVYEKYCGAHAEPVIKGMRHLHESGIHLEITTLIVPSVNDSEAQLEALVSCMVKELGKEVPWHISRFFPAWKMMDGEVTPYKTLVLAKEIGERHGLKHIHLGNVW